MKRTQISLILLFLSFGINKYYAQTTNMTTFLVQKEETRREDSIFKFKCIEIDPYTGLASFEVHNFALHPNIPNVNTFGGTWWGMEIVIKGGGTNQKLDIYCIKDFVTNTRVSLPGNSINSYGSPINNWFPHYTLHPNPNSINNQVYGSLKVDFDPSNYSYFEIQFNLIPLSSIIPLLSFQHVEFQSPVGGTIYNSEMNCDSIIYYDYGENGRFGKKGFEEVFDFHIHPNPFDDKIQITCSDPDVTIRYIIVIDSQGKEIFLRKNSDFNNFSITGLSDLPKGVYFVKIVSSKGQSSKKLIKL